MSAQAELLRCRSWLQKALDVGRNTHSFIDVAEGVVSGKMQLWAAEKGCVVTEIIVYPNKKVLHIFLAGGKLEQITDMQSDVEKWAKAQGCIEMSLAGRLGWKKALKSLGWEEKSVILQKEI